MIDITKLIELYISRKDKFLKSDDRARRRIEYFKDISEIESDIEMPLEEKRARKNSAAQKLTGNGLAAQEIVDYYCRHPDFINFEFVAPIVGFWDQVLIKIYDDQGKIIKLELNQKKYLEEIVMAIASLIFFAFLFLSLIRLGNGFINYMATNFYMSKSILGVGYLLTISPLLFMFLFILYLLLNLTDLKRLVR